MCGVGYFFNHQTPSHWEARQAMKLDFIGFFVASITRQVYPPLKAVKRRVGKFWGLAQWGTHMGVTAFGIFNGIEKSILKLVKLT